jgi:hypothetical protein
MGFSGITEINWSDQLSMKKNLGWRIARLPKNMADACVPVYKNWSDQQVKRWT